MKNMVHKGWLYVASMALALLGLVGVSYTASAQVLWVLGEKIEDPLNNDSSKSQSGNDLEQQENWNGYWLGITVRKHLRSKNSKAICRYRASMQRIFPILP